MKKRWILYAAVMAVVLVFVSCGGKWIVDRHEDIVESCDIVDDDDADHSGDN